MNSICCLFFGVYGTTIDPSHSSVNIVIYSLLACCRFERNCRVSSKSFFIFFFSQKVSCTITVFPSLEFSILNSSSLYFSFIFFVLNTCFYLVRLFFCPMMALSVPHFPFHNLLLLPMWFYCRLFKVNIFPYFTSVSDNHIQMVRSFLFSCLQPPIFLSWAFRYSYYN